MVVVKDDKNNRSAREAQLCTAPFARVRCALFLRTSLHLHLHLRASLQISRVASTTQSRLLPDPPILPYLNVKHKTPRPSCTRTNECNRVKLLHFAFASHPTFPAACPPPCPNCSQSAASLPASGQGCILHEPKDHHLDFV